MARAGITYSDVSTAAQTLQVKGKNLTVENVRNFLGTGSASTISRLLNEYKTGNKLTTEAGNLPQVLVTALSQLWTQLQTHAQEELKELREQGRAKEEGFRAELATVSKALADSEKDNHRLTEDLDFAKHQIQGLEVSLAEAGQASEKQALKMQGLEERLEEQRSANERLHQLHQNLQKNLEHYQTKTQELQQQQQAALENQRVAFAQEQHLMNKQIAEALQQAKWAELRADQAQTQLDEIEDKLRTTLDAKTQLESNYLKLEAQYGELLSQNQQRQKEYEKITHILEEKTQLVLKGEFTRQALEEELEKADDQIKAQTAKIELLRSEKWQLAQEKSQLKGNLAQLEKLFAETSKLKY